MVSLISIHYSSFLDPLCLFLPFLHCQVWATGDRASRLHTQKKFGMEGGQKSLPWLFGIRSNQWFIIGVIIVAGFTVSLG
jgi:hypothetical protein